MENIYTIQQVEILSDIKAHTLRVWEKRYGIIEPKRSEGNFRYFDETDLKKILNISYLNKNGLKISKIAVLSDREIDDLVLSTYEKKSPSLNAFPILTKALIDYDIRTFENFFDNYLKVYDFEKCLVEVIYPFFEKIGILWQTSKICPAQEHLFSQYIKQTVAGKINSIVVEPTKGKILIFLRENEFHDIGTLVYHYLLKVKGYQIFNLGASVPYSNLIQAIEKIKPQFIFTAFMAYINDEEFGEYLRLLEKDVNGATIVLSGNVHLLKENQNKYNYEIIKNLDDLDIHF